MIKIECSNLEEVYQEACQRLECSITDIHIDIVQYPRNIFGIIKKNAIVIAYKKRLKIAMVQLKSIQPSRLKSQIYQKKILLLIYQSLLKNTTMLY